MTEGFKKILCAIDFSEGSQQALRVAVGLATAANAELVLAHVWYVPPVTDIGESLFAPEVLHEMNEDARRGLAAAVRDATTLGAKRANKELLSGAPWQAIVDAAKDLRVDLVVIGTHGRTGLSRFLLGSVAEQVVRHAPCSVLVVRIGGEAKPFKHVLCPIDFSDSSQQALELAATLVDPAGAITLLHVIDTPVAYSADAPAIESYAGALQQSSAEALATWCGKVGRNLAVETHTRFGRPGAETIAEVDDDPSIDLVVMGSHGRTGIKRVLLGSVAEKVVRHARCPVLVAR